MATRRIRPSRPLAPHGLPGHLVGFVEALRGAGISVGPSETVDAGRVMATLGLGNREVLREGLACAVLRRPDHRETYDAMFDLWFPAALGARAVVTDEDAGPGSGEDALPPDDVEAMREMLLDLLTENPDLADMDERLVAMIARIVEAYGKYSSSRGPSFSSYQALKAMALDELEGKLLAGLLAPYGDEPTPTQEEIAKALAAQRITQLRKLVDAETKRRTAEQLGRDHVQMYGIPQLSENVEFLRASGEQLRQMQRVVARWPAPWPPGWRPAAGAAGPERSTCARRCASRCPPAGCRSTWCWPSPARPARSWWCCATCPARSPGSATSPCCWCTPCANSSPGYECSRSSTPPTRSPTCSARKPTWPWPSSASPGRPASTAATAIPTTATRSRRSSRSSPTCYPRAPRCWCSAMAAPITATRRSSC
ncbi:vWA containing CoxE family protein [Mycobacterium avium subsp. avium 2285 (R)]|nr:vWA containing CoxE family protein [Mycobacterium avium subsp. avium 2285 (R)]